MIRLGEGDSPRRFCEGLLAQRFLPADKRWLVARAPKGPVGGMHRPNWPRLRRNVGSLSKAWYKQEMPFRSPTSVRLFQQ